MGEAGTDSGRQSVRGVCVGVAIACHNSLRSLRRCLAALVCSEGATLHICIVDDGSSDRTDEVLAKEFPSVNYIRTDGTLWWAGATNRAIDDCVSRGCEYILLLNPDCVVSADTISRLIEVSRQHDGAMVAAAVVDSSEPGRLYWAGTKWGPNPWLPFIWSLSYVIKPGSTVSLLPEQPFPTAETGGRGVLVPASLFSRLGRLDAKTFPQYGADNDFGLRVTGKGLEILVAPSARVALDVQQSGQAPQVNAWPLLLGMIRRLFFRKNGEAIRNVAILTMRHAPSYAFLPSFCYGILRMLGGYARRSLSRRRQS